MRWGVFVVAGLVVGSGLAFGQTRAPNSTTLCPITHNCRPRAAGSQQKRVLPTTMTVGAIQCPPGTHQVPNTNRCRVK